MTFAKGYRAMAMGLAFLTDGSIIVVGRADTLAGRSWAWAARVSADGSLLWDRDWTSLSNVSALFAATATTGADGAVIAAGEIVVPPEGGGAPRNAGLVMRIGGQGSLEWTRIVDLGVITKVSAIAGDGTGDTVVAGILKKGTREPSFVAQVTGAGEVVQVVPLSEDAGWVIGLHETGGKGYLVIAEDLARLDRTGRVVWRQVGEFRGAAAFFDGSVVAVRLTDHVEMVRFDASGARLWDRRVDDPSICAPVGVWTRGKDEIVVISSPCEGSEVASVTVFSGKGEKRAVHRVRVGVGMQAMTAGLDSSGGIVLAGLTGEGKGWLFRSAPVLGPREE
jgi:hypothetical protein